MIDGILGGMLGTVVVLSCLVWIALLLHAFDQSRKRTGR